MNGVGYATIQAAIDAAKGGETITLPAGTYEETAVANKSVTIQGSEGTVWKAPVDLIEGNYTLLQIAANDVIVDGIAFEGTYEQGDGAVSRAIVTNAGVSGIEIKNSSFKNLRQPGYLEGTILVENNYVENTRGWVVCANHDVTLTGNSFKDNAVDIAIIPNNVNENKFTDMAQLSQDNNGATAENQVSHITAQEGSIVVDASSESAHKNSLIDAINAAQEGDTIKLGAGEMCIRDSVGIACVRDRAGHAYWVQDFTAAAGTPEAALSSGQESFFFSIETAEQYIDLQLSETKLHMETGEKVVVYVCNGDTPVVPDIIRTSDESVAALTMENGGVCVIAAGAGNATLTLGFSGYSTEVAVTVEQSVELESLVLADLEGGYSVEVGENLYTTVYFRPQGAPEYPIVWEIVDPSVATISGSGNSCKITGISPGTTTFKEMCIRDRIVTL